MYTIYCLHKNPVIIHLENNTFACLKQFFTERMFYKEKQLAYPLKEMKINNVLREQINISLIFVIFQHKFWSENSIQNRIASEIISVEMVLLRTVTQRGTEWSTNPPCKMFSSPGTLWYLVFLESYSRRGAGGDYGFCQLMFLNANRPLELSDDSVFYNSWLCCPQLVLSINEQ